VFLAADSVLGEGLNGGWGAGFFTALVFLAVDKSFAGFFLWSAVGGNGGPNCHRIGGIVSDFIRVDGDNKGLVRAR